MPLRLGREPRLRKTLHAKTLGTTGRRATPTLRLEESYETSYRGSSLKVRRRYRKLIVTLGKLEDGLQVIPATDEKRTPERAEVA